MADNEQDDRRERLKKLREVHGTPAKPQGRRNPDVEGDDPLGDGGDGASAAPQTRGGMRGGGMGGGLGGGLGGGGLGGGLRGGAGGGGLGGGLRGGAGEQINAFTNTHKRETPNSSTINVNRLTHNL